MRFLLWTVCLGLLCVGGALGQLAGPPASPTIYYSFAPWDGAAYEIDLPLQPTAGAPRPCLRIQLWGRPEFPSEHTIDFNGVEDSKGPGRASYQTDFNHSTPRSLQGTVTFSLLQGGHPVLGHYDLRAADGIKFDGTFTADWGNTSSGLGG